MANIILKDSVYEAYNSGKMTPEQVAKFERVIQSGQVENVPASLKLQAKMGMGESAPSGNAMAPQIGMQEAMPSGNAMMPNAPAQQAPVAQQPQGFQPIANPADEVVAKAYAKRLASLNQPQQEPQKELGLWDKIESMFSDAGDYITGSSKKTALSEKLAPWQDMPEMSKFFDMGVAKTAFGTTFSNDPAERAQIIKSNFPNVQVAQDEKGNYLFKSAENGKWYADKPGFRATDILPAAGQVLANIGIGKALGPAIKVAGITRPLVKSAIEGGLGETLTQGVKVASNGNFDKGAILGATVMNPLVDVAGSALSKAGSAIGDMLPKKGSPSFNKSVFDTSDKKELAKLISKAGDDPKKQSEIALLIADQNPDAVKDLATLNNYLEKNNLPKMNSLPQAVTDDSLQIQALEMGPAISEKGGQASSDLNAWLEEASGSRQEILKSMGMTQKSGIDLSDKIKMDMDAEAKLLKETYGPVIGDVRKAMDDTERVPVINTQDAINKIESMLEPEQIKGKVAEHIRLLKEVKKPSDFPATSISDANNALNDIKKFMPQNVMNASTRLKLKSITDYLTPDKNGALPYDNFLKAKNAIEKIEVTLDPKSINTGLRNAFDAIKKIPEPPSKMVGGEIKYGGLLKVKEELRDALKGKDPDYKGIDKEVIILLDKAIKQDQIDAVEMKLGASMPGIGAKLKEANEKYAEYVAKNEAFKETFGDKGIDSIAGQIRLGIKNAGKDDTIVDNLLDKINPKFHKELLITGLFENSKLDAVTGRVKSGGFDSTGFVKAWNGIMNNKNLEKTFKKYFTTPEMEALGAMKNISERISRLQAMEKGTGADLKPMLKGLGAENFMYKVVANPVSKFMAQSVARKVPGLGGVVSAGQDKLATKVYDLGQEKALKAITGLLKSPAFKETVDALANNREADLTQFAKSSVFKEYANALKVPATKAWLIQTLREREDQPQPQESK